MKLKIFILTISMMASTSLFANGIGLGNNFSEIAISRFATALNPELRPMSDQLGTIFKKTIVQSLGGIAGAGYFQETPKLPFTEMGRNELQRLNIWGSKIKPIFGELGIGGNFKARGSMTHFDVWGFEKALFEGSTDLMLMAADITSSVKKGDLRKNVLPLYIFLLNNTQDLITFLLQRSMQNGSIALQTDTGVLNSNLYFQVVYLLMRTLVNSADPKSYPVGPIRKIIGQFNATIREDIRLTNNPKAPIKKHSAAAKVRAKKIENLVENARDSIVFIYAHMLEEDRAAHAEFLEQMAQMYSIFANKYMLIDGREKMEIAVNPDLWLGRQLAAREESETLSVTSRY